MLSPTQRYGLTQLGVYTHSLLQTHMHGSLMEQARLKGSYEEEDELRDSGYPQ